MEASSELVKSNAEDHKEETKEEEKNTKDTDTADTTSFDRDKCCKDGVWVKWIVERLDSEEKKDKYNELKQRVHAKQPDVAESCMLRYLHGLEYNIDEAEEKILHHVKFMEENDYWHVDENRISNIIKANVFCVHKEDYWERPIVYLRIARFVPSDYEFEEIRDYCFWNSENVRKAFKPHVESHLAIYDVKGLARKHVNIGLVKKIIPSLEDNMPELCAKIFVVRPSFLLNMLWRAIKPFLHKLTLDKIKFLTEKEMGPELLKFIPPENLPETYGGEDTDFDEAFE